MLATATDAKKNNQTTQIDQFCARHDMKKIYPPVPAPAPAPTQEKKPKKKSPEC